MNIDSIVRKLKDRSLEVLSQSICSSAVDDFGEMQRINVECRAVSDQDMEEFCEADESSLYCQKGILLARAKIWRINIRELNPKSLFIIADGEPDDFYRAASVIIEFMEWDFEKDLEYAEDINCCDVVFYLEHFEVVKDFRNRGLGHKLAKDALSVAGSNGLPFFIWPATNENFADGTDPKRLRKFWMTLQDGMAWSDKWETAYHRCFGEKN